MVNPIEAHGLPPEIPAPLPGQMTLEEFLESDLEEYEYVEGELVRLAATSLEHSKICGNVFWYLRSYLRENRQDAGVFGDAGFRVGERVLKPDVAFLSAAGIPDNLRKASPVPPELAVEVVSPSDKLYSVIEKAFAYLNAGTRLVWVIEPVAKTVTVYRSESDFQTFKSSDTLTGEDVIDGFSCQVAELFE